MVKRKGKKQAVPDNRQKLDELTKPVWPNVLHVKRSLRELRESRGMTQDQVAELMGFTKSRLSEIEVQDKDITFGVLLRLLRVLGQDPAGFFLTLPGFAAKKVDSTGLLEVRKSLVNHKLTRAQYLELASACIYLADSPKQT